MRRRVKAHCLIDDRVYAVVGSNGYRRGCMRRDDALAHARDLRAQVSESGGTMTVKVFYRDGSEVLTDDARPRPPT